VAQDKNQAEKGIRLPVTDDTRAHTLKFHPAMPIDEIGPEGQLRQRVTGDDAGLDTGIRFPVTDDTAGDGVIKRN
jgi:hypothetical protein